MRHFSHIKRKTKNYLKKKILYISPIAIKRLGQWELAPASRSNVFIYGDEEYVTTDHGELALDESKIISKVKLFEKSLDKPNGYSEKDVYVHGPLALSRGKKIIIDVCKWDGWHKGIDCNIRWTSYFNCLLRKTARIKTPSFENAILVTPHSYSNYYHFIVDFLLRLPTYRKLGKDLECVPSYIATSPLHSFHKQFLSLLDIKVHETKTFHTDNLLIASPRRFGFIHSNAAIQDLRKLLFNALGISRPIQQKRIYISRAQANQRMLSNETEIFSFLSQKGFEKYELEKLSVSDQIRLFASAEIIVAPHGAGLINMIFAERPVVVEMYPFDNPAWGMFACLCSTMGGKHRTVFASKSEKAGDFHISVNRLEGTLKEIGFSEQRLCQY